MPSAQEERQSEPDAGLKGAGDSPQQVISSIYVTPFSTPAQWQDLQDAVTVPADDAATSAAAGPCSAIPLDSIQLHGSEAGCADADADAHNGVSPIEHFTSVNADDDRSRVAADAAVAAALGPPDTTQAPIYHRSCLVSPALSDGSQAGTHHAAGAQAVDLQATLNARANTRAELAAYVADLPTRAGEDGTQLIKLPEDHEILVCPNSFSLTGHCAPIQAMRCLCACSTTA